MLVAKNTVLALILINISGLLCNWHVSIMLTITRSLMKKKCVPFIIRIREHLREFCYFLIIGSNLFAMHFNMLHNCKIKKSIWISSYYNMFCIKYEVCSISSTFYRGTQKNFVPLGSVAEANCLWCILNTSHFF